jgi:hypothetical protein
MASGQQLHLPCDHMFGVPPDMEVNDWLTQATLSNSIRHPPLCPPAPESGHWPDEGMLQPAGQLGWLSRRWQCVAVPPYPEERKITQAADMLRRPAYHHPDIHHTPDSAAYQYKDDCRPPGQIGVIPGSYSGQVGMREQCNRGEQHLVGYCPAQPLTLRLPVCQKLPPINPTPHPSFRVLWICTLLYPGSHGR